MYVYICIYVHRGGESCEDVDRVVQQRHRRLSLRLSVQSTGSRVEGAGFGVPRATRPDDLGQQRHRRLSAYGASSYLRLIDPCITQLKARE